MSEKTKKCKKDLKWQKIWKKVKKIKKCQRGRIVVRGTTRASLNDSGTVSVRMEMLIICKTGKEIDSEPSLRKNEDKLSNPIAFLGYLNTVCWFIRIILSWLTRLISLCSLMILVNSLTWFMIGDDLLIDMIYCLTWFTYWNCSLFYTIL